MVHPVSIRFSRPGVAERLKGEATVRRASSSSLAEELIDEGLRIRRHSLVGFRDGPTGRRAGLVGGPDIWEVVAGMVGGDVAPDGRIERAAELYGMPPQWAEAALGYYAEFTEEIDAEIAGNADAAEEAQRLWQRGRDLLAG